ncbi:RluA family pseudouridine synthase [Bacillus xiapuensis]|uniref:RluA family pseudouridine synthase n=1 Tax=Bacillus xiapuensis TaxID=2014075 RepID=UPI000C23702C|nr:RluA family pseudouridine synthase [Bacillus xiapuensis]
MNWMAAAQDHGVLLREFLSKKNISKRALTDIKFNGGIISVNGKEENVRYVVAAGDQIEVVFPKEEPSAGMQPEAIPLSILYEDEYLIAAAKPAGMNTIPSREHPSGSLANGILSYYRERGIEATVHIVTRLDRDTSGVVLIAKHRHIHHLFSLMQRQRLVARTYEALAEGVFSQAASRIELPIGRKETSIIEREVRQDGQYACTHYEVLQQYPSFAHLRLRLETGRTHQIRVHLSHIGHPLLGDDLYGGRVKEISRQALHCSRLTFHHPVTGKSMTFQLPLAGDLQRVIEQFGSYG